MLPILESISNPSTKNEKLDHRAHLLAQNRFLSGMVSKNSQIIKQLDELLSFYDSSQSHSSPKIEIKRDLSQVFDQEKNYNCKLKLWQSFPTSVCKSKYFKLSVQLITDEEVSILKEERVAMSVSLYSYDNVPRRLSHTMQGRNIFRGSTRSVLAYDLVESKHLAHFKLQIREVSSHFIGGLFYLVVEADDSLENKGLFIKPLVIHDLKVKAKESKL